MSFIEKFKDLSLDIVKINSFHIKSAHDKVIKNVGIPVLPSLNLHIEIFSSMHVYP